MTTGWTFFRGMSEMAHNQNDDLRSVVALVRRRIRRFRERKEAIGEENTKATLIDPILSALGWDLHEIEEVRHEYRRKPKDNPVDYAFFLMRTPRWFLEAKALEKDPNDHKWKIQTLTYATAAGVQWCVLTNGDEYHLYNSHATVHVDDKLLRAVKISDADQEECLLATLGLLSKDKMGENAINALWKAHFIDRRVKATLKQAVDDQDASLVRLIRKKLKDLAPSDIRESLKRADMRIDFPVVTTPPKPPPVAPVKPGREGKTPKMLGVTIQDLIRAGHVEPPVKLVSDYKGTTLTA